MNDILKNKLGFWICCGLLILHCVLFGFIIGNNNYIITKVSEKIFTTYLIMCGSFILIFLGCMIKGFNRYH
jgi:hypothetical protein